LPEPDPRFTTLSPLWKNLLDRATRFLDESIDVQEKNYADFEARLKSLGNDLAVAVKGIQIQKQKQKQKQKPIPRFNLSTKVKGGGISHSWWRFFPYKRSKTRNESVEQYDINHLTELMEKAMKMPREQRLPYFLPRAKLNPTIDVDHSLRPVILIIVSIVCTAIAIGDGSIGGGMIAFTAIVLSGSIPSFIYGVIGTLTNISNDIDTNMTHRHRRKLLYDNRYDIANFIFAMNKQEVQNDHNNFILVGYYGVLLRILMDFEIGNTDVLRDAVIEVIVQEELDRKNYQADWAYNRPALSEEKKHEKQLKYNKAFFERLIYFDTTAYNIYINHFHYNFSIPTDRYGHNRTRCVRNIAEFYILASTYQICVLRLKQMNRSLDISASISSIIEEYKFDVNILNTAKTLETMLNKIKTRSPVTSGKMKRIKNYIEDREDKMLNITINPQDKSDRAIAKFTREFRRTIENFLDMKCKHHFHYNGHSEEKVMYYKLDNFAQINKFDEVLQTEFTNYLKGPQDFNSFRTAFSKLFSRLTYASDPSNLRTVPAEYSHAIFQLKLLDIIRFIKIKQTRVTNSDDRVTIIVPDSTVVAGGSKASIKKKKNPNPYNIFVGKQITAGKTMAQAAALWKQTRV